MSAMEKTTLIVACIAVIIANTNTETVEYVIKVKDCTKYDKSWRIVKCALKELEAITDRVYASYLFDGFSQNRFRVNLHFSQR